MKLDTRDPETLGLELIARLRKERETWDGWSAHTVHDKMEGERLIGAMRHANGALPYLPSFDRHGDHIHPEKGNHDHAA